MPARDNQREGRMSEMFAEMHKDTIEAAAERYRATSPFYVGDEPMQETQPQKAIMKYFGYKHLPADLAAVSQKFHDLAHWICENTKSCPEQTVALRKLLESKDAAVRSNID